MRAVFRADAGPTVGAGHVVRCLAVAQELRGLGAAPAFAMRLGSAEAVAGFAAGGMERIDLPPTGDDIAALEAALDRPIDLLVVDRYEWAAPQETALRRRARRIAVIDDLANRRHDADLILDQTPGRQDRAYRDLSPPDCRFLLGPRFALLRAEFVEARSRSLERRRAEERFRNVVVSFGGVDSKNMTAKALDGVAQSGLDAEIVVVMGGSAPHLVSVRDKIDRLRAMGKKIELLVNTDKMADFLVAADLALGAVGGTAWERCVLGLPTIAVSLAENQDGAAQALSALGAIGYLGRHDQVDASAIAAALRGLALDPAGRRAMSEAAAAVCDGRGARRAAEAMMELAA